MNVRLGSHGKAIWQCNHCRCFNSMESNVCNKCRYRMTAEERDDTEHKGRQVEDANHEQH